MFKQGDQHRRHAEHAVDLMRFTEPEHEAGVELVDQHLGAAHADAAEHRHDRTGSVEQRHLGDVGVAGLHAHPVEVMVTVVDQTPVM